MNTNQDDAPLINQYVTSRDAELREEIILRYVPLVHFVLGRLGISQSLGADYDDSASQGLLGLIEALDRYDPGYGAQFSTYATLKIRGKVIDYLRAHDWLSRGARKRARLIQDGIGELWEKWQRSPNEDELAQHTGLNISQVRQGLVDSTRQIVSLDTITDETGEDGGALYELLADENQPEPLESIEETEFYEILAKSMLSLNQRDQLILSLYYYNELTFKEIGAVLDISESWVCQLHARLMVTLQAEISQQYLPVQSLPTHAINLPSRS